MASYVQVVLQETLSNLGKNGEVVRVRPGYARNYLVPRGLALMATEQNLKRVEHQKREVLARAAKLRAQADEIGKKLSAQTVALARSVGADDRMYGAITSKDIAAALASAGIELDRRKISLPSPIRTIGIHEVIAKLAPEVAVTFKVEVTRAAR